MKQPKKNLYAEFNEAKRQYDRIKAELKQLKRAIQRRQAARR